MPRPAGVQKRQFRDRMFVEKRQPSALFWTMQFVPQYVYELTARPDNLFELEKLLRLFGGQADQNPFASRIYFEVVVVLKHLSERSGRPER
jgi:hypothetical protein